MFNLKDFKQQLLQVGKTHTLTINNITYELKVSNMLVLCKWTCGVSKHSGQKMFSNANTIDELASYISEVGNQMRTEDDKVLHFHNTLKELTTLLPGDAVDAVS